jgi:glutathione S-transferase
MQWSFGFDIRIRQSRRQRSERQIRSTGLIGAGRTANSQTRRLRFPEKFAHGMPARDRCRSRRVPPLAEQRIKVQEGKGDLMLKFYFSGAPNPNKVALFLEEAGLPCELIPVDTRKGDQFKPEFLKVNPNGKVPAIDDDGVFVFDSNAILLYLAEKTGKFLPPNTPQNRAQLLSWLLFVASGLGPNSGQAVHFKNMAPKDLEYAANRYMYEAHRHYKILDDHLAKSRYMVGDT